MEPGPFVDLLDHRYQQQGFPPFRWTVNDNHYDTADAGYVSTKPS